VKRRQFASTFVKNLIPGAWRSISPPDTKPRQLGFSTRSSKSLTLVKKRFRVRRPGAPERAEELAFNILQASGARLIRTDYVACPGCGRTLFDLESTTNRIKAKTTHLPGVRIAVMGCIVNGPGEMADADFGYVGSLPGKVNLYVGKEQVARGIPAKEADERLIDLIKSHGRWVEPG